MPTYGCIIKSSSDIARYLECKRLFSVIMGIPSYSGLLTVLGNPILVEFLAASTILGLLWGFMEAFLFIHLGS
jgi:hypothetical protein